MTRFRELSTTGIAATGVQEFTPIRFVVDCREKPCARQSMVPGGLNGVVAIAAGGEHSLAIKPDGTVVAWGYNNYGQSVVPGGLNGVVAIAARDFSLALVADAPALVVRASGDQVLLSSGCVHWLRGPDQHNDWPQHYQHRVIRVCWLHEFDQRDSPQWCHQHPGRCVSPPENCWMKRPKPG